MVSFTYVPFEFSFHIHCYLYLSLYLAFFSHYICFAFYTICCSENSECCMHILSCATINYLLSDRRSQNNFSKLSTYCNQIFYQYIIAQSAGHDLSLSRGRIINFKRKLPTWMNSSIFQISHFNNL